MLPQSFQMVGRGVALVAGEAILRVYGVPLFHPGIAMSFGKDGGGGDRDAACVTFDKRLLLDENIELHGVDEQIIRLDGELLQGGGHRLAAGLIDVPGVDALGIDFGDGPGYRMLANAHGKLGAALRGKFFRIVEADDAAFGIENNRGGDNGTEERAAASLIETGDAHPAELPRRSLETGRAEAAHCAAILARRATLLLSLVPKRDDWINLHGFAGRDVTCCECYKRQQECHSGKRDRIGRQNPIQQLGHQA